MARRSARRSARWSEERPPEQWCGGSSKHPVPRAARRGHAWRQLAGLQQRAYPLLDDHRWRPVWSQRRSLPRCPTHLMAWRPGTRPAPQRRRCISSLAPSPRRPLLAAPPSRAQAPLLLCTRYTLQPTCAAVHSPCHIGPPMRHRHCSSWRSRHQACHTWRTHLAASQLPRKDGARPPRTLRRCAWCPRRRVARAAAYAKCLPFWVSLREGMKGRDVWIKTPF